MLINKFVLALFFIFLYMSNFNSAFAYLDPGSGSIILQILAAIGASIAYFFKSLKEFVKNFMFKIKKIILKSPKHK